MAVLREIPHNAPDDEITFLTIILTRWQGQYLSHRIAVAESFFGQTFADHHGPRSVQNMLRIARYKIRIKHPEKSTVTLKGLLDMNILLPSLHHPTPDGCQSYIAFYSRKRFGEFRNVVRSVYPGKMLAGKKRRTGCGESIDPVRSGMKPVIGQFMFKEQHDQQYAAECQAQSKNFNQIKKRPFLEISADKSECH